MRRTFKRLAKPLIAALLALAFGFAGGSLVARVSAGAGVGSDSNLTLAPSSSPSAQPSSSASSSAAYTAWDQVESPNYYRIVGPAQVGTAPDPGTVAYGELDSLGRATGAVALVTYDSMEAGRARSREDLSEVTPTGWGYNDEVDIAMPNGTVYHGFLYNRSHLVAKSLGGDDVAHNLICATRTQNVGANIEGADGGMAYCEGLARQWLEAHPQGTVYYAATPSYAGDELLARSVIVDIRSSDGSLDERIEVYNAAYGFDIDYATGAFSVTGDAGVLAGQIRESTGADSSTVEPVPTGTPSPSGTPESDDGERKVIVTGSGKAYHHDETCRGLVNARSMEWVSVSEAEGMGRHPCGICGG